MYSGATIMWLATAVALGSFVAPPVFLLIIPMLVLRLLNEEKFLCRELPGFPNTVCAPATGSSPLFGKTAQENVVAASFSLRSDAT